MPADATGPKPKGWPAEILYLNRSVSDPTLSKSQSHMLARTLDEATNAVLGARKGPAEQNSCSSRGPPVKITRIENRNHPAFGQHGLFSTKKLLPGQFILEYIGFISVEPHCSQSSDYILRMIGDIAVDAEKAGNEARFINDYRGIGPRCNVVFENFINARGQIAIGIFVGTKPIAKGEELLLSYGKGFWRAREETEEWSEAEGL